MQRLESVLSCTQEELVLEIGDASLVMKKDGTIFIEGRDVTIKASGRAEVNGQRINVKAMSTLTLKGQKIEEN
jgi:type VI secretion system secreted protein VgrG